MQEPEKIVEERGGKNVSISRAKGGCASGDRRGLPWTG